MISFVHIQSLPSLHIVGIIGTPVPCTTVYSVQPIIFVDQILDLQADAAEQPGDLLAANFRYTMGPSCPLQILRV